MKTPHLLRVEGGPGDYAELVQTARRAGLRVGWLDLEAPDDLLARLPRELGAAAGTGVLRAVAVGPRGQVAAKPVAGAPVLRDLLREHFLGCRLVLVRGEAPAPRLAAGAGRYEVAGAGVSWQGDAEALVARLERPRPWG